MAHVNRTVLGAATRAGKWYLDINTATYAAPNWIAVNGVSNFTPKLKPTMKDDSDYDSAGYGSQAKTGLDWEAKVTVGRKVTVADATVYDPGQEALRAAAALLTASRIVDVRWYEVTTSGPAVEAYRGYAEVEWGQGGGAHNDLETVEIVLIGRGQRESITHPDAAAVVPVLYSVDPAVGVQAGGTLHHLMGKGFYAAGVADVQSMKLGVTNVPTFHVLSDHELVFVAPAKTAAAFVVYVTNSVGESVTATVTITVT